MSEEIKEWEERFDKIFFLARGVEPPEVSSFKARIKSFIKAELRTAKQQERQAIIDKVTEALDDAIDVIHGGGNGRRVLLTLKSYIEKL